MRPVVADHGEFIEHRPCPECGSKDNLAVYADGYAKCFSADCGFYTYGGCDGADLPGDPRGSRRGGASRHADDDDTFHPLTGTAQALPARRITQETCDKWKYVVGDFAGKQRQIANFVVDGQVVAQKVRMPDKSFVLLGSKAAKKSLPLYGQWLWRDGGRKLVITEGELDALSMSQAQGNKWPVVSVPNGAQSAARAVLQQLEWVEKFDQVVIMFDMDEPGQKAAREVAELLKPGKAAIASLPLKDANEMLVAGRTRELIDAMWGAKTYRPDGIVHGEELWGEVTRDVAGAGIEYPEWCSGLNEKLQGIRPGELVAVTAGSGIGKSSFCRQLAVHLATEHQQTVGYLALEESVRITTLSMMSIHAQQRWTIDFRSHSLLTPEEQAARRAAFDATVGTGRYFFFNHFGSTAVDHILSRIRYLVRGCGCRYVFLDHLSILVSALDDTSGLDERKLIDRAMTMLRTLVEELGCALFVVSHLRRPGQGSTWDQGRVPSMSDLRGSASIEQLSDTIVAFSRDMSAEHSATEVWVLKNRPVGMVGNAGQVTYDYDTGLYRAYTAADSVGGATDY